MDPVIANLDLDPPAPPSPWRRGLLPALVINALFFVALGLGVQWKAGDSREEIAARPDTSSMGGPPAAPEPAAAQGVAPDAAPGTVAPSQPLPAAKASHPRVQRRASHRVSGQP